MLEKIKELLARLHNLESKLSGRAREHAINYQYELENMRGIINENCEHVIGDENGVIASVESFLKEHEQA